MPEPRHGCPGDCGATVARRMLACRACWWRLPEELRNELNRADQIRRRNPNDPERVAQHRRVVARALRWYRDNNPTPRPPKLGTSIVDFMPGGGLH